MPPRRARAAAIARPTSAGHEHQAIFGAAAEIVDRVAGGGEDLARGGDGALVEARAAQRGFGLGDAHRRRAAGADRDADVLAVAPSIDSTTATETMAKSPSTRANF